MATLQAAIAEIQAEVDSLVRLAPATPPDNIPSFPFAVCYPARGEYFIGPPEVMTGKHVVIVELHVEREGPDLERAYSEAIGYAKSIPNAIWEALKASTYTTLQTIDLIRYEFGAMAWGEQQTFGFRFYLEGVKTQDAIT